jgi:aminoglycoside/choline kinase family phosphotransferase
MDGHQLPAPWVRQQPLVGDASTRSYSRLWDSQGASAILVCYPEDICWQIERDLEVRAWCELHGVRVPALLEHPPGSGLAVIEDLGQADAEQGLRKAPPSERATMTSRLIEPLVVLADIATSELPPWNRPLDATRLRWELAGFELWFLRHRNDAPPTVAVSSWLDDLATEIDHHPKRVCHRDYHLNNLFFLASGEVAVIDFQDILVGPDTYDIVSLLHERAMPHLLGSRQQSEAMELWARQGRVDDGWELRARQVRLQRALKVLGSFARFEATGKSAYAPWMLALAREVLPDLQAAGAPPDLTDLLLD